MVPPFWPDFKHGLPFQNGPICHIKKVSVCSNPIQCHPLIGPIVKVNLDGYLSQLTPTYLTSEFWVWCFLDKEIVSFVHINLRTKLNLQYRVTLSCIVSVHCVCVGRHQSCFDTVWCWLIQPGLGGMIQPGWNVRGGQAMTDRGVLFLCFIEYIYNLLNSVSLSCHLISETC